MNEVKVVISGDVQALNAVLSHLRSLGGTIGVYSGLHTEVKILHGEWGTSVLVSPGKDRRSDAG